MQFRALHTACRVPMRPASRVQAAPKALQSKSMEQSVHRYFDSLNSDDHVVEEFVSPKVKLFDNTNQACYTGYPAIKHRMQSVHESLPLVKEVSDVVDTAHNCVAAHYVAKGKQGEVSGTYVFKFDDAGMIAEVVAYHDSDEEEFLEA